MTTEFDDIFVPLAFDLIEEFGKTVTITDRNPVGSYDPKLGKVVAPAPIVFPDIKIIPPDMFKKAYSEGSLVETGKHITGIAAKDLAFTPINGMTLDLDGEIFVNTSFKPIYSGDLIALYLMEFWS